MPNVLDIRRRIRSVRSTQQITKAMKMVATAKLRKAQERALDARPYANMILEVLNSLVARTQSRSHPLLQERPEERIRLVVVTADKGLCGAFNTNIIKTAQHFLEDRTGKDLTRPSVVTTTDSGGKNAAAMPTAPFSNPPGSLRRSSTSPLSGVFL